jgi:uncharacterized protein involved in exopolysaccharide biosynthesis
VEIADYLKVARRSLWVLLFVPLGAALLAGVVTVKSPPMYQATATIDLPLGDGKSPYAGSHGQVLYVDAFRNAIASDPVITAVAVQTGVHESALTGNLQVKQVGDSSVMAISYTARNKDVPPIVVKATATATLDRILQAQYDASNPALEAATDARQPLLDRQAELAKQTGGVAPDHAIRSLHREIASLKRQQHNLQARGVSPTTLAAVEQQLKQTQAQIVAYAPIALKYQTVKTELNAASQVVNKQSQTVQAITVLQEAAKTPSAVIVTPAKRKPRLPTLISSTVAAAAAGAFLALGIIAVMELLARRRRQRSELLAASEAEAPTGTDPPVADPSPESGVTTEVEPARSRWWKLRHRRAAVMHLPLTQK